MTPRSLKQSLESWEGRARVRAVVAKYWKPAVALLLSVAITVLVFRFGGRLADLQGLGYLGVFVVAVLGNATVILPVPGLAVVFAGGGVLNPLLVGLVAGVGEPLGELTGYLAGYGGSAVAENRERYERIRRWMERRGFVTLLVLSAVPNPLFDLAGMAAGMLRYPVPKFLLACWIGKTFKALVIAYLGSVLRGLITWL